MEVSLTILLCSASLLCIARGLSWLAERSKDKARAKFKATAKEVGDRVIASAKRENE